MKRILPFLALHLLTVGLLVACIIGGQQVDQIYSFLAVLACWPVFQTGSWLVKEVRAYIGVSHASE